MRIGFGAAIIPSLANDGLRYSEPEVLLKGGVSSEKHFACEKHFALPERQKYFSAPSPLAIVPTLVL